MLGQLVFDIMREVGASRPQGEANVTRLTQRVEEFEEKLKDMIAGGRFNGGQYA